MGGLADGLALERRLGQLPERFGQCNGGIGGNGPRSLETLLIHHDRFRLLHLSAGNACCYGLVPEGRPAPGWPFRG